MPISPSSSPSTVYNPDNLWQAYGFDPECPVVAVFFDPDVAIDFVLHDERRLYVDSYRVPSFIPTWWSRYPAVGETYGKAA
jgi:hypothetical protein